MSIRCAGDASRSFIIGSRLWPPAITRASGPRSASAAIAPSTLVARSYSNGAGVCIQVSYESGPGRRVLPGRADVVALLVALRGVGSDHRRAWELRRCVLAHVGVQLAGREAAALDVAEHLLAAGARGGDRRLATEASEREGALRVHLADSRRRDAGRIGEVPESGGAGARVDAVDQAHRIGQARLLHQQALERVDAGVELGVDVDDDLVHG